MHALLLRDVEFMDFSNATIELAQRLEHVRTLRAGRQLPHAMK